MPPNTQFPTLFFTTLRLALCSALVLDGFSLAVAQIPQLLNYQGRVIVDGVNFDSSSAGHDGLFKFALVNGDGTQTYWSNDGTSSAGSEPTTSVALSVRKGLYSVLLGDTAAGMAALPPTALAHPDVRLRVWFDDGVHGIEQLVPDQRIAAVAYAIMAADVPDGSISSAKIAPGAIQGTHLASEAVQSTHLAAGAVENSRLANPTITINTSPGLAGGGPLALGGTLTLSIPNGGIGAAQIADDAVQAAHIAAGAVDNSKLATPAITIHTGGGLAGGGLVALGGTIALNIPNGGIGPSQIADGAIQSGHIAAAAVDNTKLANSAVVIQAGPGLAGGGPLSLGGATVLSIANGGIDSAHIADGGVQSINLAPGAALANVNASPTKALLGTWNAATFKGLDILKPGSGTDKPALLLDRGIAPIARVFFQGSTADNGWSGLHFTINADRHDETSYFRDTETLGASALVMEYNWQTPAGDHWAEINWTITDARGYPRRIFNFTGSMDDYPNPAGIGLYAHTAIIEPSYETFQGPTLLVEATRPVGSAAQVVVQNVNMATPSACAQIVLRGFGLNSGSNGNASWSITTDRFWNGTNNFCIYDNLAGIDRLWIDENGKVGIGTNTPSAKLEVNGSVKAAGAVSIGGGAATWTQGTNAPTAAEPDGSLYSRVNAGASSGLYVRENGVWVKK